MKTLTLEQPVDSHLKPIKDSDLVNTAMEISTNKVRITDLEIIDNLEINTLTADNIILDSTNGNFIYKNNGTEFSVADSSYAGMILGYRMIGEDGAADTYTLTTSFVVPDSAMTVRFIAPPSGAVEIEVQIYHDGALNNATYLGLSDNGTYNTLGASYEVLAGKVDETDEVIITCKWVVTGLTVGSTYQYWLGAKKASGIGTSTLAWGGSSTGEYPDFIMKVTALPVALSNFAEYD